MTRKRKSGRIEHPVRWFSWKIWYNKTINAFWVFFLIKRGIKLETGDRETRRDETRREKREFEAVRVKLGIRRQAFERAMKKRQRGRL